MAFREKIESLIASIVRIGTATATRIALKNNGGVAEFRNNADAAFIVTRGADPVGVNDFVTLGYFNTNPPAGTTAVVRFTITAAGGATQDSVTSIPAGNRIFEAREEVVTPWSAGTTVNVGNTATPNLLIATADVDEESADTYVIPQDTAWPINSVVRATVGGAPGVGSSIITVFFATPDP